jgi:hypothetical protein
MRYTSKQSLLSDIRTAHESLYAHLDAIPRSRYREPGVWGDDWTVADLVAHLAEWQSMFLTWYGDGLGNGTPAMPAPGYKWNETPKLNRAIWQKHHRRSPSAIRAEFDSGYARILKLVESLSEKELLTPGHFSWTGRNPLTTYIGPNTASHYRFALKVIERWLRGDARSGGGTGRPHKRLRLTRARPRG